MQVRASMCNSQWRYCAWQSDARSCNPPQRHDCTYLQAVASFAVFPSDITAHTLQAVASLATHPNDMTAHTLQAVASLATHPSDMTAHTLQVHTPSTYMKLRLHRPSGDLHMCTVTYKFSRIASTSSTSACPIIKHVF